jgi:hypothetical protein
METALRAVPNSLTVVTTSPTNVFWVAVNPVASLRISLSLACQLISTTLRMTVITTTMVMPVGMTDGGYVIADVLSAIHH